MRINLHFQKDSVESVHQLVEKSLKFIAVGGFALIYVSGFTTREPV